MKKLILLAGVTALAACSANEAEDATTEEEAVEETAMEAAEGPGMVGTYTVYNPEGEMVGTAMHNADGTYMFDAADEAEEDGSGTWENRDGMMCADGTEAEGEEDTGPRCWTPGETGEDGRMMWTSDDEEPITAYTTFEPAV